MTTVINNPKSEGGNGMGLLIGIAILVLAVVAFIVFALPALRRGMGGTNINIPDKIDVNVGTNGVPATK